MRAWALALGLLQLAACASLPGQGDPLEVSVLGIDPLPSEGMELRLAVRVRVQNPNDVPVDFSGAALRLEVNGRRLASGVSDEIGTVGRYAEAVLTIPVTISAFDMARQVFGFMSAGDNGLAHVPYRIRGKLEGGLLGTKRFVDTGTLELPQPGTPL